MNIGGDMTPYINARDSFSIAVLNQLYGINCRQRVSPF
jgi:hypothetical protein